MFLALGERLRGVYSGHAPMFFAENHGFPVEEGMDPFEGLLLCSLAALSSAEGILQDFAERPRARRRLTFILKEARGYLAKLEKYEVEDEEAPLFPDGLLGVVDGRRFLLATETLSHLGDTFTALANDQRGMLRKDMQDTAAILLGTLEDLSCAYAADRLREWAEVFFGGSYSDFVRQWRAFSQREGSRARLFFLVLEIYLELQDGIFNPLRETAQRIRA